MDDGKFCGNNGHMTIQSIVILMVAILVMALVMVAMATMRTATQMLTVVLNGGNDEDRSIIRCGFARE